ncbi:MAG: carbon-nitrogen hydrolase family protein [Bryobacteraceae bacterium]
MLDSVRAAAIPLNSHPGCTRRNLEAVAGACARAAARRAALALFPELSLTGFLPNHPVGDHNAWLREALRTARAIAEPLDGPAVEGLIRIARECGIAIAAGLLEDAGNVLYNTCVLATPAGLAGTWRKLHVPMFEMPFYNGGPAPHVAAAPLGRIGANICFDALMPESTRLLAVENVEIVLFPFAADPPPGTAEAWAAWAGPALRARCAENGVFGVACNYAGPVACAGAQQEFPGGAMIVGPRGEILEQTSDMALAELRAEDLRAARAEPEYLFRFRRPEIYGPLAS